MSENQKRTLEQVVMDASEEWCDREASPYYQVGKREADAIAAAVREWMREQNEGLHREVLDVLRKWADVHYPEIPRSTIYNLLDAILSVIPPRTVSTGISPAEADDINAMLKLPLDNQRNLTPEEIARYRELIETTATEGPVVKPEANKRIEIADPPVQEWRDKLSEPDKLSPNDIPNHLPPAQAEEERINALNKHHHDNLVYTEPLYAWANKRIEMLEAELVEERLRIAELEQFNKTYQKNQFRLEDELAKERERTKWLEDMSGMESWNILSQKAKTYDALREKFPFLPGEEVWSLRESTITKGIVWAIRENITRVTFETLGITIDCDPEDCHPTAEACRNAIEVEE